MWISIPIALVRRSTKENQAKSRLELRRPLTVEHGCEWRVMCETRGEAWGSAGGAKAIQRDKARLAVVDGLVACGGGCNV